MSSRRAQRSNSFCRVLVAAIAALCFFSVGTFARSRRKISANHSTHHGRKVTKHKLRSRFHRGRRGRYSLRHHRARRSQRSELRIAPERTEQIQQALIQAGDLHEQPTGTWDPQTRQAMKLYQQSHGFNQTGLPDAKSLMKMGLGPHPLPFDTAPLAEAQPAAQTPAAASHSGANSPLPND